MRLPYGAIILGPSFEPLRLTRSSGYFIGSTKSVNKRGPLLRFDLK